LLPELIDQTLVRVFILRPVVVDQSEFLFEVSLKLHLQGFFACYKGKRARQILDYEVCSLKDFVRVGVKGEVLQHQLPSRDESDCD